MSQPKFLIDTNVFIELEGEREVAPNFSQFQSLAAKHNLGIYIHQSAKDDIARDKDKSRRAVSLSKIEKFQIIAKVSGLTKAQLEADFGSLAKENDVVDATLLHALRLGVADFVVTEDRGLHDRARKHAPELSRQILFVGDAVALIRSTYEPVQVPIRYVQEVDAHTIPLNDPIFDSLRQGYPDFNNWWQEKCVKKFRKCWIVVDGSELAGIIVRKEEKPDDTDAKLPGQKILKVCTFKVRPESRGIKLGELLLKQVLWHAQANNFNVVYLTTYPEQVLLIDLLEYYGFVKTFTNEHGEMTYEKAMALQPVDYPTDTSLFDTARLNYPAFYTGPKVKVFGVPIREAYHDVLFPELKDRQQQDLFELLGGVEGPKRPGNTIRKVYLCRAQATAIPTGSVLLFYKGASLGPPSQALTTVGIFEDMKMAHSTADLMRMAGGRSVYSERDLEMWKAGSRPVKVINFLLAGHITPAVGITNLNQRKIFKGHPPQSIFKIGNEHLSFVLEGLKLGG